MTTNSDATPNAGADNGAVDGGAADQEVNDGQANTDINDGQVDDGGDANTDTGNEETISIADAANTLGVEESTLSVAEDGTLQFATSVNGKTDNVSLVNLLKNHQLDKSLTTKSMDASNASKNLTKKFEERNLEMDGRFKAVDVLVKALEKEFLSDYDNVDWKALASDDKEEYNFQQNMMQQKMDRMKSLVANVESEKGKISESDKIEQQSKIVKERQLLGNAIPEWADNTVAEKDYSDMAKYAGSVGFEDTDFNSISDHRSLVILRKAMKYDELQSSNEGVLKKVKNAPKFSKSGSSNPKNSDDMPMHELMYGKSP